jgi:tetratricopeptide (TPR) repeat protein
MNEQKNGKQPLAPRQALRLNEVCERFEAAWKAAASDGPPPAIADFLIDRSDADYLNILRELVFLDIEYHRLRGEVLERNDYLARFPDLAKVLDSTVQFVPIKPTIRSDRYIVTQYHARGGLGEVWMAQDGEIGRMVAVKRLRDERRGGEDRFMIEAQITGQLEHPGIVPVHDLGMDDKGRPFYVMTFINGTTLKKAIDDYHKAKPTDPESAEVKLCRLLENFVKICQTIAYAHSRGVIHRDLKPDNVMLGEYGETLVIDWGLAKLRGQTEAPGKLSPVRLSYGRDSSQTQAGMIMGSPQYMPPEVAEGQGAMADERTDLYLLGATLYAILTGRAPRHGSSQTEIIKLAKSVPPPPPRQVKKDIPRALDAICQKAMAQRKEDRYGDALDLAADIERYLAGTPVTAYRERLPERLWRWCKKRRRALIPATLAAMVIIGLSALSVFLLQENEIAKLKEADAQLKAKEAAAAAEKAQNEADAFRRTEAAKKEMTTFMGLADERQYYTGLIVPSGERNLQYDIPRGEKAGAEALKLAAGIQKKDALPSLEKEEFETAYHDLILLTVQTKIQNATDDAAFKKALEQLDLAAALREPSRGLYLLKKMCYEDLNNKKLAEKQAELVSQSAETALSHFLEGEWLRMEANDLKYGGDDGTDWKPNAAKLEGAIGHFQKALRLDPKNFWCTFQMSRCYLGLGRADDALNALKTCVALRPNQPWAYSVRGLVLALSGQYEQAKSDLDKALELRPDFGPALLNRGYLFKMQKEYDAALADFDKALALPKSERLIVANYYKGLVYLDKGERAKAQDTFETVLKENKNFRPAYLRLFEIKFLEGKNYDKSLDYLTKYINEGRPVALKDENWELHYLRGQMLRQLAASKDGRKVLLKELKEAEDRGGKTAQLYFDLGAVHIYEKRTDKAFEYFSKAWDASLQDKMDAAARKALQIKILNLRGWTFAQKKDYEKASEDFGLVLKKFEEKNAEAFSGLGFVYAHQRAFAAAQSAAGVALAYGANKDVVLHNVACIYAELSVLDKDNAVLHFSMTMKYVRRCLEINPMAIEEIRSEAESGGSFYTLRDHPDFKKLLEGKKAF